MIAFVIFCLCVLVTILSLVGYALTKREVFVAPFCCASMGGAIWWAVMGP